MKILILVVSMITWGTIASASDDPKCTYNEWKGELVRHYEAHEPAKARGWAPLSATLCKESSGKRYVIVGYNGIGLGHIRDVPLRALEPNEVPTDGVKYSALILPASSSVGDEYAYEIMKNSNIENGILFTTSPSQVLVFHKELGEIFSNTLFLK